MDQFIDVVTPERADRHDFSRRQDHTHLLHQPYQLFARNPIDLIDRNNYRPLQFSNFDQKGSVFVGQPISRLHDAEDDFALSKTSPRRINHAATERTLRLVKPGGVDQDDLGIWVLANSDDASTGGLRLGRYDSYLLPNDSVEQSRFADVRATRDRDKSRMMLVQGADVCGAN
jgi:hypothetical protein